MSFHGYDPGDRNNWYQSPQLGLFPVSPAGYGGGISAACYLTHSSHPHDSPSYPPPPQFPFQPSYSPPPPPPPPSQTIINGYVFPHQFPGVSQTHAQFSPPPQLQPIYPTAQQSLTITPRSPSIPHSNPNPWIYPPISQSLSYEPHSQSVSTKSMTTTPIYHSTPPPPACEQPHTIADPKPLCPIPEYDRISLETERVHNWELPIVDSGCYSFTPEPMAELEGVEKPQSPPRGSGGLQDHKDHTDAKLREMQKSFKNSMDTFMSEFREELRLLRGSSQSPVIQVDNTLKFGSQPDPTIAMSLTASGKPSSSTTATAGGNNIAAGMTEKLVLNVDKNIVGSVTGVKFSDSHGSDVANSIVGRNDAQTQHTSSRNGSSAGYGELLGSHNHNSVGSIRVDFHEREEKELEDEDGEDDNEDEGENDGAESYGDGSLTYSDDSHSVDGQIVTDSYEEVVIDEERSRLCIKKEALLGDSELIHDKDHMLEDHKQSIIVTDFPQLLWDEENFSQVTILTPRLEATLLNRNLVESFATIAVSMLDFSKHASKHKTIDFEQFILYHFDISELMATLEVANLQACLPNWKVRVKFSTSSHKGYFEYDLHITNLIESIRINAQNLFVHMHEKQIETKSSALHCFGFINSISNIGIQTIVPSFSHAWDFQIHQLGPPLPTSGHFEVINFAKGLLAFQIYFSIGTIGSKMTVIASIGEIYNQILQPQMCNSIFAADSTKLSPFVLVILDIELHNQESLSRPLFGANPLLRSSLDSDDFRSAVFNFFHHWLCIVLVQAFAKSEGLLNHVLEAPGPHEWLAGPIEIGNPYALFLAQKMGEKVYGQCKMWKLMPDPFIPSKLFSTDEDIAKTFQCVCEVIVEGSHLPSSHDCKHLPFDVLLLLIPRLPRSHIPICLSYKVVQCITAAIAFAVILVYVVFLTAAYVRYKLRDCCCTEKELKPAKNGRSGSLFQKYIGKIHHVASIMVARDVASREFDITHVAHVINFDFSKSIDDYVHRIGHTGMVVEFAQQSLYYGGVQSQRIIYLQLAGDRFLGIVANIGTSCSCNQIFEAALKHLVLASRAMVANGQEVEVNSVDSKIGDTYLPLSGYDEAVFAYENALNVFKTTKGENHPSVGSVFIRLTDLYNMTGKVTKSISYYENALRGHSVYYLKVVASVVIGFTVLVTWHLIKGVKEDSKAKDKLQHVRS
ncbi:hypothetical protein ABKV19_023554 [Rosa sericea]